MPKPREDLLKKYWELLEKIEWEHDDADFYSMDALIKAIEVMETELKRVEDAKGSLSEKTEGEE